MIANLSCPENISKLYVDKQETEGKKFFSFLIQKFCLDHYEHVRLKLLIPNNVLQRKCSPVHFLHLSPFPKRNMLNC